MTDNSNKAPTEMTSQENVKPKADEVGHPLVTFALFAYNQEQFIREALEGAFSQTYSPLEIIISDDCSKDRTFEIIEEMVANYTGPHNIILNKNKKNLGIGSHINKLVEISSGELIVLAAGDDISLPERTSILVKHWLGSGKSAMSLYSDATAINEDSISMQKISKQYGTDYINIIANEDIVLGCAHAFDRKVFEVFGPLNSDIVNEDQVIPFRSILLGSVTRIPQELVKYRICPSEWKSSSGNPGSDNKFAKPRYKGGVLRISALEQMKKDVCSYSETGCKRLPIKTMNKEIDGKIHENYLFVSLIDGGIINGIKYFIKRRRFGPRELRALKRYIRLLIK